jgi:RNA polymerase sigma-70 factor (ECF subfamily)
MSEDKEKELIIAAQKGDIAAFEQLISLYQQKIFNIAYFKVQDPHFAEDVSQEVIIKIFKKIKTFKFQSTFSYWVYRITCNVIVDVVKKLKPVSEVLIEDIEKMKVIMKSLMKKLIKK